MASDTVEYRPDTINVSAKIEEDIEATHADVGVVIRGASLFGGDAALKKAREVASLVAALESVGVAESSVELRGVQAEVVTGTLGNKSSTATYTLRIRKVATAQMADVIGVVTSQKNTSLGTVEWKYGNEQEYRTRLLTAALAQIKTKAAMISQALGVRLIGVYSLVEGVSEDEGRLSQGTNADYLASPGARSSLARARVDSEELGLAITHYKHVKQTVEVVYRVSALGD